MAQVFLNSGLTVILNQFVTAPTDYHSSMYVGLFTGLSGTTVPAASGSPAIVEVSGQNYARQQVTFGTPTTATSYTVPYGTTTLNGAVSSGLQVVTVASVTNMVVGMTIVVGTESPKVITAINGTAKTVVLSSALASNQSNGATVTFGDAVTGVKSIATAPVLFSAQGTWTVADGFFITTASTSGTPLYAANFSDNSIPVLYANDTLNFTPTWLLSN